MLLLLVGLLLCAQADGQGVTIPTIPAKGVDNNAVQATSGSHPEVTPPTMYALNGNMDFVNAVPSYYYYLFPAPLTATIPTGETDLSLPLCGQIVSQTQVTYVLHPPRYSATGLQEGGETQTFILPLNPDASVLSHPSDCDPVVSDACQSYQMSQAYVATLQIWIPDTWSPSDPLHAFPPAASAQSVWSVTCQLMYLQDAGPRTCPNGYYASAYLSLDSFGYVSNKVDCVPCAPGTWLTCNSGLNCFYNIPTVGHDFSPPSSIYPVADQVPVKKCFSCPSAGSGKVHYGGTHLSVYVPFGPSVPLLWKCPGGADAPALCNATTFAGSNANHTLCVCKVGDYSVGGNLCVPCLAGHMCPDGFLQECPDNYYQDQTGQSSCLVCTTDGTAATATTLCGPNQLPNKCVGQFKAVAPKCYGCNQCIRDYTGSNSGQVPCYT